MIRTERDEMGNDRAHLDTYFTFIGMVYRESLPESLPGLFRNPMASDAVAYAEVRVFVPKKRLVWWWHDPVPYRWGGWLGPTSSDEDTDEEDLPEGWWEVEYQPNVSEAWTLWNQHWTTQLVPTTQVALSTLLQTPPPLPEFSGADLALPTLSDVTTEEIGRISPH